MQSAVDASYFAADRILPLEIILLLNAPDWSNGHSWWFTVFARMDWNVNWNHKSLD